MFATRNSIISHLCRSTKTTATLSPFLRSTIALHQRQFSAAPERRLVRDTAYPFPLYYHLLPPTSTSTSTTATTAKATYALSFLPTFPQHTRQVVGYLNHSASDSEGSDLQVKPNKFTENEAFNNVLHTVIQQNLADDPMVESVLQQQLEGWTHIADYRNPAPYGRIPLPEDIFGSVQIVDGVIQPETYQRMPTHRIVSSLGLFQLSDHLHERLVQYLKTL